jgi:uncharacterized protein (DUF1800 family)
MQSEIAVIRFGLGARPGELAAAAGDPRGWLLAQVRGEVPLAIAANLAPSDEIIRGLLSARAERRAMREDPNSATPKQAANVIREAYLPHYRAQVLARAQSAAVTERPFAERLVHFWTNHFAISADKGAVLGLGGALENEAIRPYVNGRFVDLLTAVEQHPAMLAFLDNQYSIGPNSQAAQVAARRNARRQLGINENLGREILELHTLGVDGGYSQTDVTNFAKVLTGWSIGGGQGRLSGGVPGQFYFRDNMHEPGDQHVLGKTYRQSGKGQGEAVLADLARRPATAHFLATKLVRHFIADDPPTAAVERVGRRFLASDGDLPAVYRALLECPEAWESGIRKYKTPEDFVFSTLRALDVRPSEPAEVVRSFELLGQRQYTPGSPAGWGDTAKNWDGSDALMHRVLWASRIAGRFEAGIDPAQLANASLGAYVRPDTLVSLRRASSASQAVTLLLMSPEFQRR